MAAVGQVPHHARISFSGLTSIKLSENRILMSRGSRGSDLQMASNNPMQREEEYETEEEYVSMAELDEENVNWTKLCCRIFSLVLFLGIIILVSTYTEKYSIWRPTYIYNLHHHKLVNALLSFS